MTDKESKRQTKASLRAVFWDTISPLPSELSESLDRLDMVLDRKLKEIVQKAGSDL